MSMRRFLSFAAGLTVPGLLAAAQVTLSASTTITSIAEPVELRLIVRSLETVDEIQVTVPAGAYEVLRRQSLPMIRTSEWRTFEQILTIAFFRTGEFAVGPLKVELLAAHAVREQGQSGTIAIRVRSLLDENDRDIRPLKKLLPMRGRPLHLLKWAAGGGLLLLLAVLLWRRRRSGSNKNPTKAAEPVAPEIELEMRIQALWLKASPPRGESKFFFIQLGEIVKHFLAREYGFNANDLTSSEIVARLGDTEKDRVLVSGWETVFRQADLVKFAEVVPEAGQIQALADRLSILVGRYRKKRSLESESAHVQAGR
jgi:hypothetical protein